MAGTPGALPAHDFNANEAVEKAPVGRSTAVAMAGARGGVKARLPEHPAVPPGRPAKPGVGAGCVSGPCAARVGAERARQGCNLRRAPSIATAMANSGCGAANADQVLPCVRPGIAAFTKGGLGVCSALILHRSSALGAVYGAKKPKT